MPLLPSSVETWLAVQLASRVQMFLPFPTAASLAPSLENDMLIQFCIFPPFFVMRCSVQLPPEFVEVQMFPFQTPTAR